MNWLIDTDKIASKNSIFEKKSSKILKTVILYVDKQNNIINITKDKRSLINDNIVTKDEVINLLIENNKYDNVTYNSYKIMKFNINLDIDELEDFIEYNNENDITTYTDIYNNINDIIFEKSIFENLNNLFIILKEKTEQTKNKTKRILCNVKTDKKKTRKYLNISKE